MSRVSLADYIAQQEVLADLEERHGLVEVGMFVQRRVGWRTLEVGGQVPIMEPYPDGPRYRWYCRCGAVSGHRSTDVGARIDHERHVAEQVNER
jgi:hypothetical protein